MNWKLIRLIDRYAGIPLVYAFDGMRKLVRKPPYVRKGREAKKILLIKLWGIGNLFMMLPAVSLLRDRHPGVELHLFTLESNRDAAMRTHSFSSITTVNTRNAAIFISTVISSLRILRRRDYDIVIDFEQFARFSALCTALVGRKETIGFNTASQHRHFLYSHPVPYSNTVHISRSYNSLAAASGASMDAGSETNNLSSLKCSDRSASPVLANTGIRPDVIIVLMHVGTSSNFSERRWPAASYAALADLLIGNHKVQIVLGGLAEEKYLAADVIRQARCGDAIIDVSGKMSFPDYFELISVSDLVISADTMAVHVASALGVPVVGLYGPNTPVLYGPWGINGVAFYKPLECSPCITNFNAKTHNCKHPDGKGACMKNINAEEVYREIRRRCFDKTSSVQMGERQERCYVPDS